MINLDRATDRLAEFNRLNGHLRDVSRFSAIDGRVINRGDLVRRGLIDPALDYTDGAVASMMSHLTLWDLTIQQDRPLTICEDDAIFNRRFDQDCQTILAGLAADWHIVFWGWNFDAFALFELLPGVSPFLAQFDQNQMRTGIEQFQSVTVSPRCFRLLAAFGIVCYSISPAGARTLRDLCIPLRNRNVPVPMVNRSYVNRDLGIAVIEFLRRINAFASFPPLVITKNDHATSQNLSPGGRQLLGS